MTPNKLPPLPEKFRKRPVVIEAMGPLSTENFLEIGAWCGGRCKTSGTIDIQTLESHSAPLRASLGDYVIKGVQGEFYPCKPDIFAATYEPAEALRQSQSLPAGAVAGLARWWYAVEREDANKGVLYDDAAIIATHTGDFGNLHLTAGDIRAALQADAREKGEAVGTVVGDSGNGSFVSQPQVEWHSRPVVGMKLYASLATQPAQASEKDEASTDYRCACGKLNYQPLPCANCGESAPATSSQETASE